MAEKLVIGNVTISLIVDMVPVPFDPAIAFPEVPWEKWEPYRREHLYRGVKFQPYFSVWVVRSPRETLLVDTGIGPGPHQQYGGGRGEMPSKLKALGIAPEEISKVVITHLHFDHVGWNVTKEKDQKRATFPRAKYFIPKGDWEHYTKPQVRETAAATLDQLIPLQAQGALEMVSGEYVVTPEVTTLASPGHTPGHQCVVVSSQGEKAVIVGDLFNSSAQVSEPDWAHRGDGDRELARKTRRALLDRFEREGFVVGAGHLPTGRSMGKIVRLGGRHYWQAL